MYRDQLIGAFMMIASIVIIIVYAWLLFFTEWTLLLIQITLMIVIAGVLGIFAWIGYTLATIPPPRPIEEIERELETETSKLEESQEVAGREEEK